MCELERARSFDMDSDDLPNARDLEELVHKHTSATSRRVPRHLTFHIAGSSTFALAGTPLHFTSLQLTASSTRLTEGHKEHSCYSPQ